MRRTTPFAVALVLAVTAAGTRAEVAVGSSLEWLTCKSDLVVVGRIEKVVSTRAPKEVGGVVYHEITVAVAEAIKGKAAERVTFRYDSGRLQDDARLAACMWSTEPTLWFLTATKDGKFAAMHSEGSSPVFDLADPGKLAFAADMKILVKKDAILAVCRDVAKALADHLKRHPNGGVAPKQVGASGEVGKALWAGSATLLIVPEFTTGEKK